MMFIYRQCIEATIKVSEKLEKRFPAQEVMDVLKEG
jgi:hypothetical protein